LDSRTEEFKTYKAGHTQFKYKCLHERGKVKGEYAKYMKLLILLLMCKITQK